MTRAARMQGLLFLLIMGWGVWQGVAALSSDAARNRLASMLNMTDFLAGRTAATVNHIMAHALPADRVIRAAGGSLRYLLFGSGGPQVRVGCDDWLFLTEELRPWPEAEAILSARADALARIATALNTRGIELVVTVVPDKARVQSAQLCGAPLSAQSAERHDAILRTFREKELRVVPLLAALRSEPVTYYRTDTHWNQRGAALAAQAVAQGISTVELSRAEEFRTLAADVETEGPGDLLRLMGLDETPNGLRPQPDLQRVERTVPANEDADAGGLLDEAQAPEVVLIGSSYSLNANFHGRLQEALRSTVLNAAKAGGGFAGAAMAYFTSPAFRETPPKLILWEVPERAMFQPAGEEERAFLASPPIEPEHLAKSARASTEPVRP